MKGEGKMIALHLGDKNNPKNNAHISIYMTSIEYERCSTHLNSIISLFNERVRNEKEEEFLNIKNFLNEINKKMESYQEVLETEKKDSEDINRHNEEKLVTSTRKKGAKHD